MSSSGFFKPRKYHVRLPTDTGKMNGSIINPPRIPEIGGATTKNMDRAEDTLSLKKPGGTR